MSQSAKVGLLLGSVSDTLGWKIGFMIPIQEGDGFTEVVDLLECSS
jgi:hypothetical protein